MLVSHYTLFLL